MRSFEMNRAKHNLNNLFVCLCLVVFWVIPDQAAANDGCNPLCIKTNCLEECTLLNDAGDRARCEDWCQAEWEYLTQNDSTTTSGTTSPANPTAAKTTTQKTLSDPAPASTSNNKAAAKLLSKKQVKRTSKCRTKCEIAIKNLKNRAICKTACIPKKLKKVPNTSPINTKK
jgi:hypothetical protein